MTDYRAYSYWLETAGDDLTPRPPLPHSLAVDVAILGAGFTGLWTAYYLQEANPDLTIAIIEREIAGFGASGRNGGWATPTFAIGPAGIARRFGLAAAQSLQQALYGSLDELVAVLEREGIDADLVRGGKLRVARGLHQLPAIQEAYREYQQVGLGDHHRLLDSAELADRIRVGGALGALWTPDCAVVHPGKLVRGLARAVERRGATIYEQTEVTDVIPGSAPRLATPAGDVQARTVVLAGEAYLSRLRPLHRQLIPVYSLIVLTEPLTDAQWEEIGWSGRECLASPRLSVDYLSRTRDGRILFGGRGAPYHLGSRLGDEDDRHASTHAMLRRMATEWFPQLRDVAFTHAWGGPVGVSRDWMPTFTYDRESGIASARAYAGQGVVVSNLAGRVLRDLIVQADSPLTRLPMVGHHSPDWEPEPLRWLGVRYVQRGLLRTDARAERRQRPPSGRTLAERLGAH
ncbi:MAG TPA: FAD-dependent oxidoreductase [Candidatus Dormibacteraeota bacterium]|nr:FAD-dependent oxidoreductase [Candidatus Dormibacteraeota bacterium]